MIYDRIVVRQSRLTKHWIVNADSFYPERRQGFRRWEDAIDEANRQARQRR